MSKTFCSILPILAVILQILHFFTNAAAQDVEATMSVRTDSRAQADISWKIAPADPTRRLWFLDEYGGVKDLAKRYYPRVAIYDLQDLLVASQPSDVLDQIDRSRGGRFRHWVYLAPLASATAAAHISWVNGDRGVLMPDDLLPQGVGKTAKLKIAVPDGWKIFTTAHLGPDGDYDVGNIEKACFIIGRDWREIDAGKFKLIVAGEWKFSDSEAVKMASEIYDDYTRMFGAAPSQNPQIAIMKFPGNVGTGNWEADTRGNSVTIVSSDMPFVNQSLQRLHEQLRHEIFHLWIPNGLNLTGNYDWFYEGFALYQSLKIGVGVNRLRFDDFLATLSQGINIDTNIVGRSSLIDASATRWLGSGSQVYARGMLVAFLCDLAMLDQSRGKRSTSDLVREIYEQHGGSKPSADGNASILAIFRIHPELAPIADRYIVGTETIDWGRIVKVAGLELDTSEVFSKLKVAAKPTSRQKDLLDKLGYNNWRKLGFNQ